MLAQNLANDFYLTSHIKLYQQDAWQLTFDQKFDLVTSSGLNVYERNREKVLDLYRKFYLSLKKEGTLIIGFLTPPPWSLLSSPWKLSEISAEDLFLERVLYEDILDLKWRNFRSYTEIEQELREVGFNQITFYPDRFHVFPTVCAQKF